jgi:hypothetical protein
MLKVGQDKSGPHRVFLAVPQPVTLDNRPSTREQTSRTPLGEPTPTLVPW